MQTFVMYFVLLMAAALGLNAPAPANTSTPTAPATTMDDGDPMPLCPPFCDKEG